MLLHMSTLLGEPFSNWKIFTADYLQTCELLRSFGRSKHEHELIISNKHVIHPGLRSLVVFKQFEGLRKEPDQSAKPRGAWEREK